jgi:hypothetical protein
MFMQKQISILFLLLSLNSFCQCVSGNCINGFGKYNHGSNDYYEGEFKDGKRHGKGAYKWWMGTNNGRGMLYNVYDGQWLNGEQSGIGKFTNYNGYSFDGLWLNGAMVKGAAKIKYENGTRYEGDVIDGGITEGKGKMSWTNGSFYIGDFIAGNKQGRGEYNSKENGWTYKGEFKDNFLNGEGEMTYTNGYKTIGTWKKGEVKRSAKYYNAQGKEIEKDEFNKNRPTVFSASPSYAGSYSKTAALSDIENMISTMKTAHTLMKNKEVTVTESEVQFTDGTRNIRDKIGYKINMTTDASCFLYGNWKAFGKTSHGLAYFTYLNYQHYKGSSTNGLYNYHDLLNTLYSTSFNYLSEGKKIPVSSEGGIFYPGKKNMAKNIFYLATDDPFYKHIRFVLDYSAPSSDPLEFTTTLTIIYDETQPNTTKYFIEPFGERATEEGNSKLNDNLNVNSLKNIPDGYSAFIYFTTKYNENLAGYSKDSITIANYGEVKYGVVIAPNASTDGIIISKLPNSWKYNLQSAINSIVGGSVSGVKQEYKEALIKADELKTQSSQDDITNALHKAMHGKPSNAINMGVLRVD